MKIAITGGNGLVGSCFVHSYTKRGHEVVNISRSLGYDFNNIDSIVAAILPCDVFINCLHLKNIQTTLLDIVWHHWNHTTKHIINISTCNTLPNFKSKNIEYHQEKLTLEEKHWSLIQNAVLAPSMCLVKLGDGHEDNTWSNCVEYVVNSIETSSPNYLFEMAVFK
jgi:hypothetical protein